MEDDVLTPVAPTIAKDLGPFLMLTSEDTLSLVLETLSSVVEVGNGSWVTPELAESLVTAMLHVWGLNNKGRQQFEMTLAKAPKLTPLGQIPSSSRSSRTSSRRSRPLPGPACTRAS